MMYHVNNDGDVKRCRAQIQSCKFAIHGDSVASAQAEYERSAGPAVIAVTKDSREPKEKALEENFDKNSFYGNRSPREVQLDALNSVVHELQENDATQLVAACGTGKTYMHRQLLRQAMSAPESNGIGVLLTSSIRLAHDTADDLRPTGGYDESLGKFGVDYEVIEVHSDARPEEDRQSVRDNGVISVERIYKQMNDALNAGKKIVIVSTYDSVSKVQEAQARFENRDTVEADLLIHDESHNILGQQKPTTVAAEDNDLTAYVGFHNEIPGSLQARKRLYSTATPIIRETEADKQATGDLNSIIQSSLKMQDGDQYERVTVYSDDPMVGKVSGFISQHEAIESKCLATPAYQIRESVLNGSLKDYSDPVVGIDGKLKERGENPQATDLNPNTYGALTSTLDAMVADSDGDKNSATNVLAYVGSINQSEAFKKAFKEVALRESGGMSLSDAEGKIYSENLVERRKARMALLAEHALVKAAHSRPDPASIKERQAAFSMFEGNAVKDNSWTPDKRVLANVNIFSEGVSISEIDAVVISDDDKLNEKAMTQAIGRAIRVVPGNDVKKYGHVIIPSVRDSSGKEVNSSSVNLAAYTATRVERGTTSLKLRGEKIKQDSTTTFKVYKADKTSEDRLGRDFAQNSITVAEDLAVATEVNGNHTYLMANNPNYRNLSKKEQFQLIKERTNEKLLRLTKESDSLQYYSKVQTHLHGMSSREVRELSRNGRVVANALASGDVSSINPKLAEKLIKHDVLFNEAAGARDVSLDDKREFLKKYSQEFSLALSVTNSKSSAEHLAVKDMLPGSAKDDVKVRAEAMKNLRGQGVKTPKVQELEDSFQAGLANDEFVDLAYKTMSNFDTEKLPIYNWLPSRSSIFESKSELDAKVLEKARNDAASGGDAYSVNTQAVRKSGEINVGTLRKLLASD